MNHPPPEKQFHPGNLAGDRGETMRLEIHTTGIDACGVSPAFYYNDFCPDYTLQNHPKGQA
jgi:hypothetical protein